MACRRATSLPRVLLNKGDAQTRSAAAFCSIIGAQDDKLHAETGCRTTCPLWSKADINF
jgi:hypothetical protein